jgi:hypothetical protein
MIARVKRVRLRLDALVNTGVFYHCWRQEREQRAEKREQKKTKNEKLKGWGGKT